VAPWLRSSEAETVPRSTSVSTKLNGQRRAELVVVRGGTHDLIFDRASDVVPYIDRHLAA